MRATFISFILFLTLLLTSCVYDDLSGCFSESGVRISFRYEQDDQAFSQLPLERVNLYLFDTNNRFVCSLTDSIGPFNSSRIYDIPLSPGDYTAVAWGNQNHSFWLTPATFIPGETTLSQARLLLAGLPEADTRVNGQTVVNSPNATLYHAIEKKIHVVAEQSTETTMNLIHNTKDITLRVRFERSADGTLCDNPIHECNPTIRSNDGIFSFENSLLECPGFFYKPVSQTHITGGYDALFRKMNLRIDESSEIILALPGATDATSVFYRGDLMKWLKGTGHSSQEMLDKKHTYDVLLRFNCDDESTTHTTVRIFVDGWEYIEINGDV